MHVEDIRRIDGRVDRRWAADALISRIADGVGCDRGAWETALRGCGLPVEGAYRVLAVAAGAGDGERGGAGVAVGLGEALERWGAGALVVGVGADGDVVGVVSDGDGEGAGALWGRFKEEWARFWGDRPGDAAPHVGVSGVVRASEGLAGGLVQARYALTVARNTSPDTAHATLTDDLCTVKALLAGVPEDVRAAYRAKTLGPLVGAGSAAHRVLLETLEVFLAHNCSWARTAEALRLHVNTVHYRVRRIQELVGRDVSRLEHALDLRAALLCG
ncbi:helix-turn-helix domain-containing protein [Streptomyces sp. NPDC003077]|uniref:PucR family transcriptional regulator n=1 Tax=Streptomyces sp. NPDC003077 TaxID=3154443 RepID=UPI0033BDCAC5